MKVHPKTIVVYPGSQPVDAGSRVYLNLRASIRRFGMLTPIHVNRKRELVHGHRRLAIALELGLPKVAIVLHEVF